MGTPSPVPRGFTAFPPEWLFSLGRLAPPRHSGRWVGAPVASLRCRILRPGGASINQADETRKIQMKKKLAERIKGRVKTKCPGCPQLAGFEVTSTGRF